MAPSSPSLPCQSFIVVPPSYRRSKSKMHFPRFVAACMLLAGSALAFDPYNITVNYKINNKDYYAQAWYGDAELYIGSVVPDGVTTVTDFTSRSMSFPSSPLLFFFAATPCLSTTQYSPGCPGRPPVRRGHGVRHQPGRHDVPRRQQRGGRLGPHLLRDRRQQPGRRRPDLLVPLRQPRLPPLQRRHRPVLLLPGRHQRPRHLRRQVAAGWPQVAPQALLGSGSGWCFGPVDCRRRQCMR